MEKQHSNRPPFTVPENYFEDFSERLDVLIMQKSSKRRHIRLWLSVAAALAGIVLITQVSLLVYNHYLERNDAEYELFLLSQWDTNAYYDYLLNLEE